MPTFEEDSPRLAEIFRNLTDFRNEFRSVIVDMVRKDVYSAHMASMQLQIDNLGRDNKRLAEEFEKYRNDQENDRRSLRNVAIGAVLSTVVAIIVLVLQLLLK